MKFRQLIGFFVLIVPLSASAQFTIHNFVWTAAGFQGTYATVDGIDWMQQDIKLREEDKASMVGNDPYLIEPHLVSRYILPGWRLPTTAEIIRLRNAFEGVDRPGSAARVIDSAAFHQAFPFTYKGMYFAESKKVEGIGFTTQYHAHPLDTIQTHQDGSKQEWHYNFHLYKARGNAGKVNVANGSSKLPTANRLRLVRTSQPNP